MCVTYEIAGNFKIKGSEKRDSINQRLGQAHAEGSSQWMPGQRRGVTHVSRYPSSLLMMMRCFAR
jgi:hypothetical protein